MSNQNNEHEPMYGQHVLGSLLLFLGAGLLLISIIESSTGLPFRMPRFWHINRSLWYFMAFVSALGGTVLLRQRNQETTRWKPSSPGIRFEQVVLFTRQDCHLCEEAKELLLNYQSFLPKFEEVDIDIQSEHLEKFDTCVPVVEIDGKIRFRGRVDELLLRRLIEGTSPIESHSEIIKNN